MTVLILNGSPRAGGNTARAVQELVTTFGAEGIETDVVQLGNKDVRGCIACGSCKKTGKCVFADIVNELAPRFEQADGLDDHNVGQVGQIVASITRSGIAEYVATVARHVVVLLVYIGKLGKPGGDEGCRPVAASILRARDVGLPGDAAVERLGVLLVPLRPDPVGIHLAGLVQIAFLPRSLIDADMGQHHPFHVIYEHIPPGILLAA